MIPHLEIERDGLHQSPFRKQMKACPPQVWKVVGRTVQCPWVVRAEKLLPPLGQ